MKYEFIMPLSQNKRRVGAAVPVFAPWHKKLCRYFLPWQPLGDIIMMKTTYLRKIRCPLGGRIGNRVKVPGGPATVTGNDPTKTTAPTAWEGVGRKAGSQETCLIAKRTGPSAERGYYFCWAFAAPPLTAWQGYYFTD